MGTGRESYRFGAKNNWRRRIWNNAIDRLEKLGKKVSDCTVVYLPGPENIDGLVAIDKGFKPLNLYAVENNAERVMDLRKNKINVINGDLADVVMAWHIKEKIDFLFADLCCGISRTTFSLLNSVIFSDGFSPQAVVAFNMLRGRDKLYREAFGRFMVDLSKHRGLQLYRNAHDINDIDGIGKFVKYYNKMTEGCTKPDTFEYSSICNNTKLVMDSIIFNWGSLLNFSNSEKIHKTTKTIQTDQLAGTFKEAIRFEFNKDAYNNIKRRINAAKAINSMRYR